MKQRLLLLAAAFLLSGACARGDDLIVVIRLVEASRQEGEIETGLQDVARRFKALGFKSFKLLGRETTGLPANATLKFSAALTVTLVGAQDSMKVTGMSGRKKLFATEVSLKPGVPASIALPLKPSVPGNKLILAVSTVNAKR